MKGNTKKTPVKAAAPTKTKGNEPTLANASIASMSKMISANVEPEAEVYLLWFF